MARVKAFCCVRPREDLARDVAALPYDVYSRAEAKEAVADKALSFLRIDRPETNFSDDFDMYSEEAYEKASSLLKEWTGKGIFVREDAAYYLYELVMEGRSQTGIVACCALEEYRNGTIRRHENTRKEKEEDRIRHIHACRAQTGPIFLAYRQNDTLMALIGTVKEEQPLVDFVSEDGIAHRVWKIADKERSETIEKAFEKVKTLYIADGHHRAASAAAVGSRLADGSMEDGEWNYFLSVLFDERQLKILPYNRVIRDLNTYTREGFLEVLAEKFYWEKLSERPEAVTEKGTFGMFLGDAWYRLRAKKEMGSRDAVESLDVSLLQNHLLGPLLGIADPRTDNRIAFVGGIRGAAELERMVKDEGWAVAFLVMPTSLSELFAVADEGKLMPPKSTWFEPKLRSGLFIHEI